MSSLKACHLKLVKCVKQKMKVNNITRQSLLNDFYGVLITPRQREVMEFYHDDNLSLTEISEELNISRQAVYDTLKSAGKALEDYESKLGLLDKFMKRTDSIIEIDKRLDKMIDAASDKDVAKELNQIREIVDNLEE